MTFACETPRHKTENKEHMPKHVTYGLKCSLKYQITRILLY